MIEHLKGTHETIAYQGGSNVRLFRNNINENYPIHWHNSLEIVMPTINEYTVKIGNRDICLSPGDIIIIHPGSLHALSAPPSGERMIFQAETTFLKQINELENSMSMLRPYYLIRKDDAENDSSLYLDIHSCFQNVCEALEHPAYLGEADVYTNLLKILISIGRGHEAAVRSNEISITKHLEYISRFDEICTYLRDHCTSDLTLDAIAARAGFSKYHFSRLFKQYTNYSFYKYVNIQRIAYAENLIANPELSITEIASTCGFESISSFIRMFKILKGCTPTAYRSLYTKAL